MEKIDGPGIEALIEKPKTQLTPEQWRAEFLAADREQQLRMASLAIEHA